MIAPVGEKLLFEHTKFSATRGGDHPYPPPCIRHCSRLTKRKGGGARGGAWWWVVGRQTIFFGGGAQINATSVHFSFTFFTDSPLPTRSCICCLIAVKFCLFDITDLSRGVARIFVGGARGGRDLPIGPNSVCFVESSIFTAFV